MTLGYNRPIHLLPFDHRHSCITGMWHFNPPLTAEQREYREDFAAPIESFRPACANVLVREWAVIFERQQR